MFAGSVIHHFSSLSRRSFQRLLEFPIPRPGSFYALSVRNVAIIVIWQLQSPLLLFPSHFYVSLPFFVLALTKLGIFLHPRLFPRVFKRHFRTTVIYLIPPPSSAHWSTPLYCFFPYSPRLYCFCVPYSSSYSSLASFCLLFSPNVRRDANRLKLWSL